MFPFRVLFLILFASVGVLAQQNPNAARAKDSDEKLARELEAERVIRERRANAESLLINLAADAHNITDPTVRARTQARIANVLWNADRDRSRALFRFAWEAAETADTESRARMQEDIRQQQARTGNGGYVIASPPNLRREVLELAAKRDQKLGEELLAKYKESKDREATDERNRRPNPFATDEATSERFSVAKQLVDSGDIPRALQLADPALNAVNVQSVDFLARLRDKDPAAADQRYAALLAGAPANPQADANTVSILMSYIFTPHLYVTFESSGASTMQMGGAGVPANVSPELRSAFFRTAATILSRPVGEQSSAGPDGQYLALRRMLPIFEQNAPAEMTSALKSQFEALAASASPRARERTDDFMRRGIEPEKTAADRERALLDQVDHAKTAAERDEFNLQLAMLMVNKDDRRARDFVDKIDDSDLRDSSRKYIDASIAWKLVQKNDVERALELVRTGDLSHFQKAWLLAGTARALAVKPNDRERAANIIEDAATEARRVEESDPDRARAFLAIANALMDFNPAGMWEVLNEAVRAANTAESFTGEDGEITFRLMGKGMRAVHQHPFRDFDVAGIFGKLADQDYDRAVDLARTFQRTAPRANATIAIARAVLEEKKN